MNHIISLTVVKKYWSLWSLRYIDGKKNVRPFSFFLYSYNNVKGQTDNNDNKKS